MTLEYAVDPPNKQPPKPTPKQNRNNNKKRQQNFDEEANNNKKSKSDDELLDMIVNNIDFEKINEEMKITFGCCNNPLCDHQDYTEDELQKLKNNKLLPPKEIKDIDDLIELGKTYHCKKNKVYYGINMRILCNLVPPLTKLKNLVGMKSVKETMVNQIIFFLQNFNHKEKCNDCYDCAYGLPCAKNKNDDMLHTVITGPPGVGKTELGKILGQVYKAMEVLSNGELHIATRSDLVGKFLGHTAAKTQEFIDKCKGGVMFIDEAYSLGNAEGRDSFSKECLDTINQNLSERRDFLCIIAGYADALDKCFFSYNEGLKRRFSFRYDITGYTADELMEIFLFKLHHEDWYTQFDIKNNDNPEIIKYKEKIRLEAKEFFNKNYKNFPHYGGDIESLIMNCKIVHGKRVLFLEDAFKKVITIEDIDKGFDTYLTHRKYKGKNEIPEYLRSMYI